MSVLFNPQPLEECYDKWFGGSATTRVDMGFDTNTLHFDLVNDAGLITSPTFLQDHRPGFTFEPNIGSINETNIFYQRNPGLCVSNLNASVRDPPSWYYNVPLDDYQSNYPLYQNSQMPSFPDLPLSHPSGLTPLSHDPYTTVGSQFYSSSQCLNQVVLHKPDNIDVREKHAPGILNNDTLQLRDKFHSNSSNANAFNNDAWLHRCQRESISVLPTEYWTGPNGQKPGMARATMIPAHVGRPDFWETRTLLKRKAFDRGTGRGEEEKVMRCNRNLYQCKLCYMSFSTGNALGGHMSYHAKKKKLEAQKAALLPKQPHDSGLDFVPSGLRGSVNLSLNTFR